MNGQEENGVVNMNEKAGKQEIETRLCLQRKVVLESVLKVFLCSLLPGHIRCYDLRKLNGSHTELPASFHHTFEVGLVIVLWRFCHLLRPH